MRAKTDTIAAISTPAGVGGIAVVRISGSDALAIVLRHLDVDTPEPRHATYCHFADLDDVVAVYFPRGYSGEPTVEISCHGSRYIQEAVMQALVAAGARMAEAGEFTLRAFMHGRLDLSQAEAVADLIDAATPAQHLLAVSQLRGSYAQELKSLRQQLLDLTSLLELELDFSQEDVEFADRSQLKGLLSTLNTELSRLIKSFVAGNALKKGVPVAIVGAPNVGKSTLLNALLGDDRAIVSDIPGTTRDTIEETLNIEGITFRLVDTAGLRHTDDQIERLGIERSQRAIEDAQIVITVIDATTCTGNIQPVEYSGKHSITVVNKSDLAAPGHSTGHQSLIYISALTRTGIETLKHALHDCVADSEAMIQTMPLVTNIRHHEALVRVQDSLQNVQDGLDSGTPTDLVAVDLRDALYNLGTITGDVANDEILSNIFSRFCIGK